MNHLSLAVPSIKAPYIEKTSHNPNNFTQYQNRTKSQSELEYNFKIILLGDISVGKTSIMKRFVENEFNSTYHCTIGVEYKPIILGIRDDIKANLKIWDTCGEEKYRTITRQYYLNANGVILVFDLTNKSSFMKLNKWISDIKDNGPEGVSIVLVGNKADVKGRNLYISEQGKDFANRNNIPYIEVSAKLGDNIDMVFETLTRKMIIQLETKLLLESEETDMTSFKSSDSLMSKRSDKKNRDGRCCS